jgi:outer membrane protein OmpA-like peptidoglycan-associated protein
MGGYDVFKTVRQDDGTWSDPVNLGYPLNTPDDDIYFVLTGNAQVGYISAIRNDTYGFTDIYQVHLFTADPYTAEENFLLAGLAKPTVQTSFEPPVKLLLVKGKVTDKNGNPIAATVEIIDNKTGKVIYRVRTNSASGEYIVSLPPGHNYAMVIKKEGYLFHSENFDLVEDQTFNQVNKNVVLENIAPQSTTQLRNIFFDYNSASLKPESYSELNMLANFLKEHPNIKIEISGHTDSLGNYEYNMKLSLRRANSVVNYLVKQGIDRHRLIPKGYGPTKPIASNKTPEGRALNRRVEFKIIEVKSN